MCSCSRCVDRDLTNPYFVLYLQVGDAKKDDHDDDEGVKNLFVRRAETRSAGGQDENHFQFALGVYGLSEEIYPFFAALMTIVGIFRVLW